MKTFFIVGIALSVLSISVKGQNASDYGFFSSNDVLNIDLTFDIKKLIKTKEKPENLDAVITIVTGQNESLTQDIHVKARGEMRRKYCSFPPIMLKFKDKEGEEPIMKEGNLKLVTHCDDSKSFDNYVLKEYLAYRLYNITTPYSFRVRLVNVTYTDVNNPAVSYNEFGFLIENMDQLTARTGTNKVDFAHLNQKQMNEYEMARLSFFNFMIGNTDWSIENQHNIKVLQPQGLNSGKGIPLTYDFDFSGFVNTRYSAPNEKLPIKYVTDRYYQGICLSNQSLEIIFNEFLDNKEKFLQTINDFEYLTNSHKKQALTYIENFFKKNKSHDALFGYINRTCIRY